MGKDNNVCCWREGNVGLGGQGSWQGPIEACPGQTASGRGERSGVLALAQQSSVPATCLPGLTDCAVQSKAGQAETQNQTEWGEREQGHRIKGQER